VAGAVFEPEADDCASAAPCVEEDLGWALGVVFRRYVKESESALRELPGGPRAYQVLTTAGSYAPRRQLALAQQLGIDRTVMTYLLDDLEAAGLVERQPDPTDRRARLIAVTEKGRTRTQELRDRLESMEVQVLAGLDAAERADFRGMLQRIAMRDPEPVQSACDVVDELQRTGMNPDS
jgi:DNA-binding MarR family transcriptional regulator